MSVYIKNMELPKGLPVCIVIDMAGQVRHYDLNNDRYTDDELFEVISVHPHGRLVDANVVERNLLKMQQAQTWPCSHGVRKSRAVLRNAPTIIEAEPSKEE